jgi:2-polyprenyl-6-methoxyphenol hydroxylase-like FAD-dependent oxidoreductase
MQMYDPAGKPTIHVTLQDDPEPRPGVPYPGGLLVSTARVEAALRDRLAEFGREVELDRELRELTQDDAGVEATMVDSGGGTHRVRAAYVVGADGGRSAVRKLLGLGFAGESREDQHLYVGDVVLEGIPRDDVIHMWPGGVSLASNPHADTWWMTAGMTPDADGKTPEPTLELLEELFRVRTGLTHVRFLGTPWLSKYRFNVRMVDRYRSGRVFVAGDAAHVHVPAGGQGMNTGIQDGYNLGWKLGAVLRGADPALLDTYEHERLPIARDVLAQSTARANAMLSPSLPARLLMVLVFRVQPLAGVFWRWWGARSNHLDLHCRSSTLSRESAAPRSRLRAGDRVPDVRLWSVAEGREIRLFDVLRGTHWTVLGLGTPVPRRFEGDVRVETIATGAVPPGDKSLLDRWGEARRLLGRGGDTVLVVRPDGYLGLRGGGDPDAVASYLAPLAGRAMTRGS